MADYRDWCPDCGAEINFGGHERGCAFVIRQRSSKRERAAIEKQIDDMWMEMSKEEILERAHRLKETMNEFENAYLTYTAAKANLQELHRRSLFYRQDFTVEELRQA